MFELTHHPIIVGELTSRLLNPRAGALVTFEGWVRNHHEGRDVLHLEYEAYPALCLKEAQKLEAEVRAKFEMIDLVCVHRTGHCGIGAMAVWVGVTAEHRGPAYAASEYYMNQLKVRLPIWKKETYVDGQSDWVRCEACAEHAHEHGEGRPTHHLAHEHGDGRHTHHHAHD
jgi:molybdopterin synthase catalytic subunit